MIGIPAEFLLKQVMGATHEEPDAGQQGHSHGELAYDQQTSQALMAPSGGGASRSAFERMVDVHPGSEQRRGDPEDQCS